MVAIAPSWLSANPISMSGCDCTQTAKKDETKQHGIARSVERLADGVNLPASGTR
jgi:hypothetical protein